jgi:hypothetical protein
MKSSVVLEETSVTCFFRCPLTKKSIRVRSGDQEVLAIAPQCPVNLPGYVTFNHRWTTSHSAMELCHAETITSASRLEAHLQTNSVEQFPENHNISEHSACQVAGRDPR